jgi:hypothetical protein
MEVNYMESHKEYLGDGVYARIDGKYIVLTTENGVQATNIIYLESSTLKALDEYIKRNIDVTP